MEEHTISLAGDPFYAAGEKRRAHTDLLTAIREEQANRSRHLTDSGLERFARHFYAPEYRTYLRRIIAVGCDEPGE